MGQPTVSDFANLSEEEWDGNWDLILSELALREIEEESDDDPDSSPDDIEADPEVLRMFQNR